MTKTTLGQVIQRAIGDPAFRRQLKSDPKSALRGTDLTAAETAALTSGDPTRLSALGVDQRMSKAFAVGLVAQGQSAASGSDLGTTHTALTDENVGGSQAALVSENPGADPFQAGLIGDPSGAQSALADANAAWPDDALIADATAGGRNALADANAAWPDDALSTGAGIDDSGTNAIIDPGSVDTTDVADMPGPGIADQ